MGVKYTGTGSRCSRSSGPERVDGMKLVEALLPDKSSAGVWICSSGWSTGYQAWLHIGITWLPLKMTDSWVSVERSV